MKTSYFALERIKILFAFINIYLVWGATYFAITFALKGFPPFVLSGIRFITAGLILLIWRKLKKDKPLSIKNIGFAGISGILVLVGGTGMVSWAQQYISSSEAAILGATQPFFFILFDKKQWPTYFGKLSIILGLTIGFFGLILFINQRTTTAYQINENGSLQIIAYLVLIASAASWVIGALFSKRNSQKFQSSVYLNAAWQFIAAGIVTSSIAALQSDWETVQWNSISSEAWGGLSFLIFAGSLASYLSFSWLITKKPAALVSTFTYVNPVVAVLLGVIFLQEHISINQYLALFIILIGVLLTNLSTYKLPKAIRLKIFQFKLILAWFIGIRKYVRIIQLEA